MKARTGCGPGAASESAPYYHAPWVASAWCGHTPGVACMLQARTSVGRERSVLMHESARRAPARAEKGCSPRRVQGQAGMWQRVFQQLRLFACERLPAVRTLCTHPHPINFGRQCRRAQEHCPLLTCMRMHLHTACARTRLHTRTHTHTLQVPNTHACTLCTQARARTHTARTSHGGPGRHGRRRHGLGLQPRGAAA